MKELKAQIPDLEAQLEKYQQEGETIRKGLAMVQWDIADNRAGERVLGIAHAFNKCAEQNRANAVDLIRQDPELKALIEGGQDLRILNDFIEKTTQDTINDLLNHNSFKEQTPAIKAKQAFVSHVIIPHLSFFIMQAQENEPTLSQTNANDFAVLQQLTKNTGINITTHPQDLASKDTLRDVEGEAIPLLDLSFMKNPTNNNILQKQDKASALVDAKVEEYDNKYKELIDKIQICLEEIAQKTKTSEELHIQKKHNQQIDEKIEDTRIHGNAKQNIYTSRAVSRLLVAASYGAAAAAGNPHAAVHCATNSVRLLSDLFSMGVEYDTTKKLVDILEGRKYEGAEKNLKAVQVAIDNLKQEEIDHKSAKEPLKAEAMMELFVTKSLLDRGKHVTAKLMQQCSKVQKRRYDYADEVKTFTEFWTAISRDKRLAESVQNLCLGYADSNDLAVIIAESDCWGRSTSLHQSMLKEFVEEEIKPNIDEYAQSSSKVDFIYQTNLCELGTSFHKYRKTLVPQDDAKTQVLFTDAFGVKSNLEMLTIAAALDVKGAFGYYLSRHGKGFLADDGIIDGRHTNKLADKRVSLVPDEQMQIFINASAAAGSVRAKAPEINDMFTRICAYEYQYPLAIKKDGVRNIMAESADSPATYIMVNATVKHIINQAGFADIADLRKKVGKKVDEIMAQSFIDFFQQLGSEHSENKTLTKERATLASTEYYSSQLRGYSRDITELATTDDSVKAFWDIYTRNLSKYLEHATEENRAEIEAQLKTAAKSDIKLNPDNIIRPGTAESLGRAKLCNHTLANTHVNLGVR